MSFKRQVGLLLIDRPENISKSLVKGIVRGAGSALHSIFTHSSFNRLERSITEGRKLAEVSIFFTTQLETGDQVHRMDFS